MTDGRKGPGCGAFKTATYKKKRRDADVLKRYARLVVMNDCGHEAVLAMEAPSSGYWAGGAKSGGGCLMPQHDAVRVLARRGTSFQPAGPNDPLICRCSS